MKTLEYFRAQIAKSLPRRRYGFVFGCNTLATLVIDTVFTVVVVDEAGMNADVHVQVILIQHNSPL